MRAEVTTPENWLGDVMGDLSARRGQIVGIEARGRNQVVRALVPLPDLLDYAQGLRAVADGHATYEARSSYWATAGGDEPDGGAGTRSPLRPVDPGLPAGAAAEPPPDEALARH
jgi:translation elongation factor EF-G